ncbi:hypothetical protein P154DRAFT_580408 [Amniculicola lignicola CBS 123094]|uniref:Uncharacterized protein n=1 Tax=Amniculicola lignicola CBS 123094 TaxID=1392246 RepID=A0A6A5W3T1_9PLEO|nr:hypothetical protein P154DRAFT_580408 [Amniculicola lignicola CBS 123094]
MLAPVRVGNPRQAAFISRWCGGCCSPMEMEARRQRAEQEAVSHSEHGEHTTEIHDPIGEKQIKVIDEAVGQSNRSGLMDITRMIDVASERACPRCSSPGWLEERRPGAFALRLMSQRAECAAKNCLCGARLGTRAALILAARRTCAARKWRLISGLPVPVFPSPSQRFVFARK